MTMRFCFFAVCFANLFLFFIFYFVVWLFMCGFVYDLLFGNGNGNPKMKDSFKEKIELGILGWYSKQNSSRDLRRTK
jgi:hypothetical protein